MSRRQEERRVVAQEAARLMMDEGVREYFNAKRMAADNVLGMRRGSAVQLPSNREIRAAIVGRCTVVEGDQARRARLFRMRVAAMDVMDVLAGFAPRLIGSVATGSVHITSDVDIQVFCDTDQDLEQLLSAHGWWPERVETEVYKNGHYHTYVHVHFEHDGQHFEVSVYEPDELWRVSISSVNGKPIDRMPLGRLRETIKREHPDLYERHSSAQP